MEPISKVKASYWGGNRKGNDGSTLLDFHLLENGDVMYRFISSIDRTQSEITITEDPEIFFSTYGIKHSEI